MATLAISGGKKVLPKGIKITWPEIDDTDEQALLKVFRSGNWWRGGVPEEQAKGPCGKFERAFAKYQGAPYGLCVTNGTTAVECALWAAGVKPGDEVIVPALSFVVSASAALPMGAVPVFADCDPNTLQMDAAAIESLISPRTAAVIVVHFGGYPANLDKIMPVVRKHKLALIEDCAHAQGSQWRGKGCGSYGDFGTFSFQQSKGLTCGEGGIVLARSLDRWRRAYRYHMLGRREDQGFYDFYDISSNLRMTDLQGALLNTQFAKMKKQLRTKMANHKALARRLREIGGLEPLPEDKRITRRGFYWFVMKYDAEAFGGLPRERFLQAMAAEGITLGRAYGTPIPHYPLFQNIKMPGKYPNAQYTKTRCPNAERAAYEEIATLSHQFLLADRSELMKVADAVAKVKENVDELLPAAVGGAAGRSVPKKRAAKKTTRRRKTTSAA